MAPLVIERVRICPLSIPLKGKVAHAASVRAMADPIIVEVEARGTVVGYGETLPREYVTGETVDSVRQALSRDFAPLLVNFHASSFSEALEAIESLPWRDGDGRPCPAARAAIELALLDATMKYFRIEMDAIVGWMGMPGFGVPGSIKRIRFSGVLATESVDSALRRLRKMYWGGLRHFKLKVGGSNDRECLTRVASYLAKSIAAGKATLRLDANGAWDVAQAIDWLQHAEGQPLAGVEQPLARGAEAELPRVASVTAAPLIHDESLVTREDADRLIGLGVADIFNIRISKCGGLLPSLRLAALARRNGIRIVLGCMVGETSVLSAAGLRFLQVCRDCVWAEGCFGSFLLRGDIVRSPVRFGLGGRPPSLKAAGLGVEVLPQALENYSAAEPCVVKL